MSRGFLYIATGEYIDEAKSSAETLRDNIQGGNVSIITDRSINSDLFDNVIDCSNPKYGLGDKPGNLQLTPYDKTIYLDTDTYIEYNIRELFKLLDNYDMGLAMEPARVTCHVENIPLCFPEYNTGVIAYNSNNKVTKVLENWVSNYHDLGEKNDQPSFRKSVYENDIGICTLPPEYNCRWGLAGHIYGEVKIFHGRLNNTMDSISGISTSVNIKEARKKN